MSEFGYPFENGVRNASTKRNVLVIRYFKFLKYVFDPDQHQIFFLNPGPAFLFRYVFKFQTTRFRRGSIQNSGLESDPDPIRLERFHSEPIFSDQYCNYERTFILPCISACQICNTCFVHCFRFFDNCSLYPWPAPGAGGLVRDVTTPCHCLPPFLLMEIKSELCSDGAPFGSIQQIPPPPIFQF